MKIAVLCPARCRMGSRLFDRLNVLLPGSCEYFDPELDAGSALVVSADSLSWRGNELGNFDIVWTDGLPYMDPVIPPVDDDNDWSVWRFDHLLAQQKHSALESLLQELERRGVRVINPRRAALACFMKTHQLLQLQRRGCSIPPLLCSNDKEDVTAFCAQHANVLWRTATGPSAWQRFTDKQREHLVALDKPPVLLAAAPAAEFHLAWILDGEVLLCVRRESPAQRPVETLGIREEFGEMARMETLEMLVVVDTADIKEPLSHVAEAAGLPWCRVSFHREGGSAVVYDVEADARLDWLPGILQQWLVDRCARRLLGLKSEMTTGPVAGGRHERPALFLRRMLQIQFEMEASKYPDEAMVPGDVDSNL